MGTTSGNSPTWARGGYEVAQDIILPYARLIDRLMHSGGWLCLLYPSAYPIGMLIRATMQNRT